MLFRSQGDPLLAVPLFSERCTDSVCFNRFVNLVFKNKKNSDPFVDLRYDGSLLSGVIDYTL